MMEESLNDRSLADVSTMVQHAKLVESNLLPVSQVISFTNSLVGDNIKLLEVTPAIADGLQSGDVFVISATH